MPAKTKTRTRTAAPTASTELAGETPVESATATTPAPHPLSAEELALVSDAAEAAGTSVAADEVGPAPTVLPPDLAAEAVSEGAVGDGAAAAITGQKVVATWAEQSNRNAWAYLQSAGWKKLSPLTDTGSTTMTLLAAHARATGTAPVAHENPTGTIATLYVW